MKSLELSPQGRAEAVASIRRYAEANLPEPMGDLAAGQLLNYFLEEIGPAIYNKAVAEAQERMQLRISDVSGELYADEFPYWPRMIKRARR